MQNCLISLKNIYRLLTADDYPQYSYPVISRRNLRGFTLVKFWLYVLPDRWRQTPHGRVIWRTQGSKNRFTSELCNRRKSFAYYAEYMDEILDAFGMDELSLLDASFISFLQERTYNHVGFRHKLQTFLHLACEQDACLDEENTAWLMALEEQTAGWGGDPAYGDARMLSALCLHAIAGETMAGGRIRSVYQTGMFEALPLSAKRQRDEESVVYLTGPDGLLFFRRVAEEPMYGRETQMFDLTEMMREGGKILLCGTGGIGKTLLLTRLFAYNEKNGIYRRVAIVRQGDSLKESFARAFSGLSGRNVEERFHEAVYLLSGSAAGNTLLFIDDMKPDQLSGEEKAVLRGLSCCVIATSRQGALQDFTSYLLEPVDLSAAMLIFRHYFRHRIGDEIRKHLALIFREQIMTYPLMLRFFGEAAGSGQISIDDAAVWFTADGAQIRNTEQTDGTKEAFYSALHLQFARIYSRAQLPPLEDRLLRLFAVLPYAAYRSEWIQAVFGAGDQEAAGSNSSKLQEEIAQSLSRLKSMGWLEETLHGFSLHPVMAESVLAAGIRESDLTCLWEWADEQITEQTLEWICTRSYLLLEIPTDDFSPQTRWLNEIGCVFHAGTRIKEVCSDRLVHVLAKAAYVLTERGMAGEDLLCRLDRIAAACMEKSNATKLYLLMCRVLLQQGDPKELYDLLQDTVSRDTVLYKLCMLNIITGSITAGRLEEARQRIDEAMSLVDDGVFPAQVQTELMIREGELLMLQAQYDRALAVFTESLSRVTEEKQRAGIVLCRMRMGEIHSFLQQGEQAREDLVKASELMQGDIRWDYRMEYENAVAWLAQQNGDWETAFEKASLVQSMMRRFLGEESANYIAATSNLGVIRAKCGQLEESYRYHDKACALCARAGLQEAHQSIIYNNAAVAFLEGEQPERALAYLKKAAKAASSVGELAVAENRYNFSRYRRLMNDTDKEKEDLQACLPAFEKIYGTKHSKTLYVTGRLEEIAQEASL